ncbi:ecto-ADP-ribosyltransferase 3 isoform X1 [Monodelphis domestica]|uniref:NAD(P)(+)--arginine ADP-ribosyltransferase n=1 Tax=Monodelphis domestica TaxID=13616 RepID=F6RZQ4_MONDO|nr:ecto-ADP-ribosyltransferase 3 isoform X1 [Monodelphis domestica]XP_007495801.1 ecto-ADP-ribosyltransferase 3 isoform X1 [Monodelphis domestica]XP_007495802.1 ecto-ADP-ribosyltransferase 3 isoform X1 [Monodelphis domestica]XP_056659268.1 ecto-ADP-ribosyltransferase 3 isoform X1 [Monodelphis domestica]XP_056659269.1 ecto-ADP-ribosyltransferase 3 isoform X1 [Monodelphis domestica]
MKMNYLEMVPMMLAAVILMEIFQVKGDMLSMSPNTFDDQYLKCARRMETKFVPKLLIEEKSNHKHFDSVWTGGAYHWELKKSQLLLPPGFLDNHGTALMIYTSHAQRQTPFYREFNSAVERAGLSRDEYIYNFHFKALHFYLTRALQLLSRDCEESYRHVAYAKSHFTLSGPHGHNGIRFSHFTSWNDKPEPLTGSEVLFTVYTCFGVSTKMFSDSVNGSILIPLNEVFKLTQEGNKTNFIFRSMNKTCSHFDCAYLGGLKTENCVDSTGQLKSRHTYFPEVKSKENEDKTTDQKNHEPHDPEEMYEGQEPFEELGPRNTDYFDNPAPALIPFPSINPTPASASASVGEMHHPLVGRFILLISAFILTLFAHL